MGIFDNVNWQQALPGALMGFAGGMDPRSSPMLAQSGWNAVKSYMEQQQMQQQQEQFQERLKLYKEEQSQRERQLKMRETSFAKEQEEKLDEDFIFQNLGVLSDISDEAGISEYYNRLNLKAKEAGRGPLSSTVFGKVAKQWEFMPTATGEVGFGYKSDGSLWVMEKVKHKGGVKWQPSKVADRITPEMIKALRESPEMALEFAKSLEKSGHSEAATGVRTQAQRILDEKQQGINEKSLAERIRIADLMYKNGEDEIKAQFGWNEGMKEFVSPYPEGSQEHAQWLANKGDAYKKLHDARAKMQADLWRQVSSTPQAQKKLKEQLGKVDQEFQGTDEEKNEYRAIGQEINRSYGDKLDRDQKIALTRTIYYGAKELKAGHKAREPVEQKPEEPKKPVSSKPVEDRMAGFRAAFDALTPEQKKRVVEAERKGHKLFVKDGKIYVRYLGKDLPI